MSVNTLYARRYRYWSCNMKNIPIVLMSKCDDELCERVIDLVDKIEIDYSEDLEMELNKYIFEIFNLKGEIQDFITNWVLDSRRGK